MSLPTSQDPNCRVTVVLVGYNSADVIDEALASIPPNTPAILVDNASADDTVRVARAVKPDLCVEALSANQGFGRACNHGAALATTEFVLFLNPDAVIAPDALGTIVATADAHPAFGILGSSEKAREGQDASPRAVPFVSGAFLLVRRSAFEAIGGFDPDFFMYFEDNDFCIRARAAGWHVGILPFALYRHAGGGSTAPRHDNPHARAWLWGAACAHYAAKHADRPEGRQARRKLELYRLRARLFGLIEPRSRRVATLRARLAGAKAVTVEGPAAMFRNPFMSNAIETESASGR